MPFEQIAQLRKQPAKYPDFHGNSGQEVFNAFFTPPRKTKKKEVIKMDESELETIVKKEPTKGQILGHMTKGIAKDISDKISGYLFGNLPVDFYEKIYSKPCWRNSAEARKATYTSSVANIALYTAVGAIAGLSLMTPAFHCAVACGLMGLVYGLIEYSVREGQSKWAQKGRDGCHLASLPGWLLSIPLRPAVNTAVYIRGHYRLAKRELTRQ